MADPRADSACDLTVAICTYKRVDMLRETLASLAACEPIDARWELLVIDNEVNEQVREVVEGARVSGFGNRESGVGNQDAGVGTRESGIGSQESSSESPIPSPESPISNPQSRIPNPALPVPIRYLPEPTTGTSHARNRAVKEAAAPIILFTDDDVTFDKHWLKRMWAAIQAQPGCGFWGGRVEPTWSQPAPRWFDPTFCPMLGDTIVQYRRGDETRRWDPKQDPPFYTANLAFRCEAIRAAGGFDTTVGHRGDKRMGMEDSLMVRAVSDAGKEGWYVADAIVHHPVPASRMTKKYAKEFAWRQGWLSVQMTRRREDAGFGAKGKLPRWFFRVAAGEWLRGVGQMIAGLVTFNPGKRFAGVVRATFNASKLWHAMKKS